jgi:hypothetical protein
MSHLERRGTSVNTEKCSAKKTEEDCEPPAGAGCFWDMDKNECKFVSFTPSSKYQSGGGDRSACSRRKQQDCRKEDSCRWREQTSGTFTKGLYKDRSYTRKAHCSTTTNTWTAFLRSNKDRLREANAKGTWGDTIRLLAAEYKAMKASVLSA